MATKAKRRRELRLRTVRKLRKPQHEPESPTSSGRLHMKVPYLPYLDAVAWAVAAQAVPATKLRLKGRVSQAGLCGRFCPSLQT